MCFAEGFWEVKNLNDTIAVVGLPPTLFSIWYSRRLARRDLAARIAAAQEQTVRRLAGALLQPDVAETARCLHEARDACRARRWEPAVDRCEQASRRIPRFASLPGLSGEDRLALGRAVDQLRLLIRQLEDVLAPDKQRTELTATKLRDLDELITTLAAIEGALRASALR